MLTDEHLAEIRARTAFLRRCDTAQYVGGVRDLADDMEALLGALDEARAVARCW